MERVSVLVQQAAAGPAASQTLVTDHKWRSPNHRRLRWNGWGFADTRFELVPGTETARITGSRYLYSGKVLPKFVPWCKEAVGIKLENKSPSQEVDAHVIPKDPPSLNKAFLQDLLSAKVFRVSLSTADRLDHAHGHSFQDIFALRHGKISRIPDLVVYPKSIEDVEVIVKSAVKHNVVLIPYGGGTTVTHALKCPSNENRCVVSVDVQHMTEIKWIDLESMSACIQPGICGVELERLLKNRGLCLGHEPDSGEFSTLGGWIATRASGMKKNKYGNIEDLLLQVTIVTPEGTIVRSCRGPRVSHGPEINQLIMGSEGTYGIIVEAVLKVSRAPEVTEFGSAVFPDFESGVAFMQEVGLQKCAPASLRLVDNEQFTFSAALKPDNEEWKDDILDLVKKWYVTKLMKFDPKKLVAATVVFEGSKSEVKYQQAKIYKLVRQYGGLPAGPESGKRGYFLTYMIAYLRDFAFEYGLMSESFETSVPWKDVNRLCTRVKQRLYHSVASKGFKTPPFVSCRVTQVYDSGACVYFYFGILRESNFSDNDKRFGEVEHEAREEVLACGGSLSHHHGVGKLRKSFLEETITPVGIKMLKALKQSVDPTNIFASGNLV